MPRFVIAPIAGQDIEAILMWTHDQFGSEARLRYKALLTQAMKDIASDPGLPGSQSRPELSASARTYHLRYSRNRVAAGVGRVKRPRHLLLYRTRPDGPIEIGRVLHDTADLPRHSPGEYRLGHGDFE